MIQKIKVFYKENRTWVSLGRYISISIIGISANHNGGVDKFPFLVVVLFFILKNSPSSILRLLHTIYNIQYCTTYP